MDSSKHTPTPWTVGPGPAVKVGRYNVAPTITAGGSAKGMIDELDVAKANAAFIVRAVNLHDQLVAALKALTALSPDDSATDWNFALMRAHEVLKAAEA